MPAPEDDDDALQALQALQDALAGQAGAASSQAQLGRLAACVHGLLQRAASLQQDADGARGAAQALRRLLASRDAEAARLQSEVRWLRASTAATAAAADAGSGDGDAAAVTTEPAVRQALLSSAVAARDKPGAALTSLQRCRVQAARSGARCMLDAVQPCTHSGAAMRRRCPHAATWMPAASALPRWSPS